MFYYNNSSNSYGLIDIYNCIGLKRIKYQIYILIFVVLFEKVYL